MQDEVVNQKTGKKRNLQKRSHHPKTIDQEGREIIEEIEKIKKELELTRSHFDSTTDDTLIDCLIYQIISLNKKYQYFLKLAKKSGLTAEGFEKIV